ncbi:hypothetical protein CDL15_Pgr028481 [Punica granatum]|uniref:Uncharacterized protein n=1 Tax=Punica granatum TaxID=22663 RepID=A0A218VW13_PUNGR|nr:hypothetical protein CDL15_Pgr028481 [Punica granatum]
MSRHMKQEESSCQDDNRNGERSLGLVEEEYINIDDRTFSELLTTDRALYQLSYPQRKFRGPVKLAETSRKKDAEEEETVKTIGAKRVLVFYCGKHGNTNMMDRPVHKYHLNADAADSTITDLARIKKGNSKKQQSKKAGSPSYEADSSSPEGIEAQETNFQEENIPTQPAKGSPSVGAYSPQHFLLAK